MIAPKLGLAGSLAAKFINNPNDARSDHQDVHGLLPFPGHLTQEQFAAKIGVTFPTINRWENGRAKPSPLAMQKIEELLRKMGDSGNDLLERLFEK